MVISSSPWACRSGRRVNKQYCLNGVPGLVSIHKRQGSTYTLYNASQAGMDETYGPWILRWENYAQAWQAFETLRGARKYIKQIPK